MANLRDVRLRMRAIGQTLQVTKAMNLISTAKLRKGRRTLTDVEPFFTRIQKCMFDILSGTRMGKNKFLEASEREETSRTAIIVITSDKGLAGGYNANIYRQVETLCKKVKNPTLILVGSVGYRYFIHSPWLVMESFSFKSRLPELDEAKEIADYIISQFQWGIFDEVHIVYTHMYSSIKLVPRERQILPLNPESMQEEFERTGGKREKLQFEYVPSKEAVFEALVPMYVKGLIYGSLVEAYVSEQSARMSAMDEASKNAEDMLANLQINYNRARQAGITQEMTEIVGGAEALSD
jgi:F-type H+-transporting ATPase subunit gamma